jgi:hypothetical protein
MKFARGQTAQLAFIVGHSFSCMLAAGQHTIQLSAHLVPKLVL